MPLGKALSEISHLRMVDRWPAIPNRACYSALNGPGIEPRTSRDNANRPRDDKNLY